MNGLAKNILYQDTGKLTFQQSPAPVKNSTILLAVLIEMVLASGIWLNAIDNIPNYLGWIIMLAGLFTAQLFFFRIKKQKRTNEIIERQTGNINNHGKLIPEVVYARRIRR